MPGRTPRRDGGEMPSEVIYGPGGVHTRVSWGPEGTEMIQIVTQAVQSDEPDAADPTERLIGIVNEWLKAAGMDQINLATLRELSPNPPFFDGWWAQLDGWTQVNRLIRTLQRARNRSFGDPA